MKKSMLTVATRRGALAVAQTQIVAAALKERNPGIEVEVKEVTSEGDLDRRTALWDLKDAGFFTSRLEDALLAGETDLAVHSLKDLPTQSREGLAVTAICDRRFPEDCLLANERIGSLDELAAGARVGTSSLRRAAQLRRSRADVEAAPIRGNVQTRIQKLRTGEFDAIILAKAGLVRLGLTNSITLAFDPRQFIPAPGQGALAVQTRSDDEATNAIVRSIDDATSRALAEAEREVLVALQCGCHAPVGAYAESMLDEMRLTAFIADRYGRACVRQERIGPASGPLDLGRQVAERLLTSGGEEILHELEKR
jgi:hydroxymethylbilane synthase